MKKIKVQESYVAVIYFALVGVVGFLVSVLITSWLLSYISETDFYNKIFAPLYFLISVFIISLVAFFVTKFFNFRYYFEDKNKFSMLASVYFMIFLGLVMSVLFIGDLFQTDQVAEESTHIRSLVVFVFAILVYYFFSTKYEGNIVDENQVIKENNHIVNFIVSFLAPFVFFMFFLMVIFLNIDNFLAENNNKKQISSSEKPLENQSSESAYQSPVEKKVEHFSWLNEVAIIKEDEIDWQKPSDLGDLGLTEKEFYLAEYESVAKKNLIFDEYGISSYGIRYVKVGEINSGKYSGADLINVSAMIFEGPGNEATFFRMIKNNDEAILLVSDLSDYYQGMIEKVFNKGELKRSFNSGIVIESLIPPQEIYDKESGAKLIKKSYSGVYFDNRKLEEAFVDNDYGKIWITDSSMIDNDDSIGINLNKFKSPASGEEYFVDIFGRGGFYLELPDGTAVAYDLELDILKEKEDEMFGESIKGSWNNGAENVEKFEIRPAGCGSQDYVYDKTESVDLKEDLEVVGKTNEGENLYGFKNLNHPEFKDLYENIYWVKEGEEKKDKEDFLEIHPMVFWVDPFERVLAFYNISIISPAECGKPVIYLYPEEEKAIKVKVTPDQGLTISDPEYNGGWDVISDTQSNITNKVDGKVYPYLFWEGVSGVEYETPKMGFIVESNNLDSFLDDKLSQLGLINKEIDDFKEFWIPEMKKENKPYYFVTFLSQDFIDKLAPLEVDPRPDTVIRVMMDYHGLDQYEKVSEFQIKTPERKGFTVVEWGGMLK